MTAVHVQGGECTYAFCIVVGYDLVFIHWRVELSTLTYVWHQMHCLERVNHSKHILDKSYSVRLYLRHVHH